MCLDGNYAEKMPMTPKSTMWIYHIYQFIEQIKVGSKHAHIGFGVKTSNQPISPNQTDQKQHWILPCTYVMKMRLSETRSKLQTTGGKITETKLYTKIMATYWELLVTVM